MVLIQSQNFFFLTIVIMSYLSWKYQVMIYGNCWKSLAYACVFCAGAQVLCCN